MTKTDSHGLSRLELWVLSRLSSGKKPITEKEIVKDIWKRTGSKSAESSVRSAFETLRQRGLIGLRPKPGKSLSARSVDHRRVTDMGRATLRTAFGTTKTPTWSEVSFKHIPAFFLGISTPPPTATDVAQLQAPVGEHTPDTAKAASATEEHRGLVENSARLDDKAFASIVSNAAHNVGPDGRYGAQKVFISAVWEQLHNRLDISLEELKHRLLDASRRGLLSLARADLVGAMDPAIVARSEIADANASFHFVIDGDRR